MRQSAAKPSLGERMAVKKGKYREASVSGLRLSGKRAGIVRLLSADSLANKQGILFAKQGPFGRLTRFRGPLTEPSASHYLTSLRWLCYYASHGRGHQYTLPRLLLWAI